MRKDQFILPDAFSHCGDEVKRCDCKREALPGNADKEKVFCEDAKKPQDKCARNGCYCQLFRRREGEEHESDVWQVVLPKQHKTNGETPFEKKTGGKFIFECFCVKPKLPAEYTLGGCDSCALSFGKGADKDLIACEGKCFGGGKCHLFRLPRPGKDSTGKEKWEHVAGPDAMNGFDRDYYYRCFCVKIAG